MNFEFSLKVGGEGWPEGEGGRGGQGMPGRGAGKPRAGRARPAWDGNSSDILSMRLSKKEQAERKARYRSKHNYVAANQEKAAATQPRADGPAPTDKSEGQHATTYRSLADLERVLQGLDAPGRDDTETQQQYRDLVEDLKKQADVKMVQYQKLLKDRKEYHHAYAALNSEIEEQMRAPPTPSAPATAVQDDAEDGLEAEPTSSALVDMDISAAEMVLPNLDPGAAPLPLRGHVGGGSVTEAPSRAPQREGAEGDAAIVWVNRYGADTGEELPSSRLPEETQEVQDEDSVEDEESDVEELAAAGEGGGLPLPNAAAGDPDNGAAQVVAELAGRVYRLEAEVGQLRQEKAAIRGEFEEFKTHMGKLLLKLNGSVLAGWPTRPLTPGESGGEVNFAALLNQPAPELQEEAAPAPRASAASGEGENSGADALRLPFSEPPPLPSSFRPRSQGAFGAVTRAAQLLEEDFTVPVFAGGL